MTNEIVSKVTISLPKELLKLADRIASERKISRSRVIAELLENEEKARTAALMEQGYREMAEENVRLAEEAFQMNSELMLENTDWDEDNNG